MERDKEEAKRLLQRCSVEVPEAAELCFLSDYITSEQGTGSQRREQLRRQGYPAYSGNRLLMMAADDNRRLDERIAAQPTVTGRVCATCFVDEKEAGYWMSGTLIGMTLGMLGYLGGFDYAGASRRTRPGRCTGTRRPSRRDAPSRCSISGGCTGWATACPRT